MRADSWKLGKENSVETQKIKKSAELTTCFAFMSDEIEAKRKGKNCNWIKKIS